MAQEGSFLRALFSFALLLGAVMAGLAWLRVGFALRFWRKLMWIGWLYVALVLFGALRFWLLT